jgi:hypothetical protein
MDEIDRMISLVQTPTGDAATRRLAVQYREAIVAHGSKAEDRIVALITTNRVINPPALYDVLAAFGTPRAAQVLYDRFIAGPEGVSHAAATALAGHPTVHSRAALARAAKNERLDPALRAWLADLVRAAEPWR